MTKKDNTKVLNQDQCKNCESLILIKDIPQDSDQFYATYDRDRCCTIDCITTAPTAEKTLLH